MQIPYYQPYSALRRGPTLLLTMVLLIGLMALWVAHPLAVPTDLSAPDTVQDLKLPLSFVPNAGQAESGVSFQVHDAGRTISFKASEAVLTLPGMGGSGPALVRMQFQGANPQPTIIGGERLPGVVNYFVGNDPALWRTNLPTYAGIVYQGLYPGIDLHYDGISGQLKGTYVVAPGANPALIRWRHAGAAGVRLDPTTGDLLVSTAVEDGPTVVEKAPLAWQVVNGQRVAVDSRYTVAADGSVGFALGSYDPALPLTIDPTLTYSTYLGSADFDEVQGIAVDGEGNVYVASTVFALPWGEEQVLVTKINAAGDTVLYSSYFGGTDNDDAANIVVDSVGSVYVIGDTDSTDLPITPGALQETSGGLGDGFVFKLNAAGDALVYATYLGGSNIDTASGVAVDDADNAYVVGTTFSAGFFSGSYGGEGDAFAAKLSADGSTLVYSIYLGGSGHESASDVALHSESGSIYAYVGGETFSDDFPTQDPLQEAYAGWGDLFVTKLSDDGSSLLFSTYFGGDYKDYSYDIAVDAAGDVYLTGSTESTDFPTTAGAFDTDCGTDGNCNYEEVQPGYGYSYADAFVAKLQADGSTLVYSTYLGGSKYEKGYAITVDGEGHAFVTGDTFSADFPTLESLQSFAGADGSTSDAFVTQLEADGSDLVYSTFLGGASSDYGTGIALDGTGDTYVAGMTFSDDFPTQDPLQGTHAGGDADGFVAKLSGEAPPPPPPSADLSGSYKTASREVFITGTGEVMTYTIQLRNSGTLSATADVTDPVPAEMNYILGSADASGGVYDEATRTLTWSDVTVEPGAAMPLSFVVSPTQVSTLTLVTNVATIAADGETLERRASVLLTPPPPEGADLSASHKTASQRQVTSGELLSYTIQLINVGDTATTANVTDPVPSEMNFVPGSADASGGVYDEATHTLTWSDIAVGPGEQVPLTFAVTGTTVTTPTRVVNIATIAYGDVVLERGIDVLLLPADVPPPPPPPPPVPDLRGSHKVASQHQVVSETLTYTIRLHNSGTVSATVDVTDPVPAEMAYIAGSVTGGGVYDAGTETLTWNDVMVPAGEGVSLSFAVEPAVTVEVPTPVINTATIDVGDQTFERHAAVLLVPSGIGPDVTPPVVHDLTIGDRDVLTSPAVTLHISATDNVDVDVMYLKEWHLALSPFPHWEIVHASGWVPYQADYPWTLASESGVHFVEAWVADAAGNLSRLTRDGLDYASLLLPGETVDRDGIVPYLVHYEAGVDVSATLTPASGDADLYVWYPGNFGRSDEVSANPGTAQDAVSFETPRAGTYLFLVYGYTAATFDLSITPAGGPQAWRAARAQATQISQTTSVKKDLLISEPVFSQSGLDPLAESEAPDAPVQFYIYLPMVVR